MQRLLIGLCVLFQTGCSESQSYEVSEYLTETEERIILDQAIRYIYYAEGIPAALRFDTAYDARYKRVTSDFYFARYHIATRDDTHSFLIVRKYPGQRFRAVGGRLNLDTSNRILRFVEVFVTPQSNEADVMEKGGFLFRQMAVTGSVDPKYYKMRSYVEWPDEHTTYDTVKHEWIRQ